MIRDQGSEIRDQGLGIGDWGLGIGMAAMWEFLNCWPVEGAWPKMLGLWRWPESWLQIWSYGWYNVCKAGGGREGAEETKIVEDFLSASAAGDCVELAGNGFCAKRKIRVTSIVEGH